MDGVGKKDRGQGRGIKNEERREILVKKLVSKEQRAEDKKDEVDV